MSPRSVALLALVLVAACARPRDDRHALLDSIDRAHEAVAVARRDPRAARAAVETLEGLRVRAELRATRDRCAALYAALLAHEESSTEATDLLDRYEQIPREDWPADVAQRMRAAYSAAESATTSAERARPDCERLRATLRQHLTTSGG